MPENSELGLYATTDTRVPVTVLTGFLGAGKTTVLNAVLADRSNGRIAVIVNEFGEAGLDHDLIEVSSDEIVLMRSGCLCCSIRGDLSQTVADLLGKRLDGSILFDRIVIETTGLADPGPILQTLLIDRLLALNTRTDGVVVLADAANGAATLDKQFEAVSQAAIADLIVVSKTDLVSSSTLREFENRLRALNPRARILRSVRGEGLAGRLWGLSALRPDAIKHDVLDWTFGTSSSTTLPNNLSGLAPVRPSAISPSPHDPRIASASIILDAPIPDATFDLWLDTLIALRGPDILRIKGIVFLNDIEAPFVFHGVQHFFDPPVQLKNWPKDDRQSRIVVIARDLSQPELQRSLDMLRGTAFDETSNTHIHEVTQ